MKQWHVLAYDVREPRRLRRLHAYLKKQALPVQYSVFVVHCSAAELAEILREVRGRVDLRVDDVRLYPIRDLNSLWGAGQQPEALSGMQSPSATATDGKRQRRGVLRLLLG